MVVEFALSINLYAHWTKWTDLYRHGQCGPSLYYTYNDQTLTFTGSGTMYDYTATDVPWLLFRDSVKTILWAPKMTSVGAYALYNFSQIKQISIPNTFTQLGAYAFANCSAVDSLFVGTGISTITTQFQGMTGLRYLELGASITSIARNAFFDATTLRYITCYAVNPPTAYNTSSAGDGSFGNFNAKVYVPCDNKEDYEFDAVWGTFKYLECIGSATTTTTADSVVVVPGNNEANMTWPTNDNAASYTIQITKDGVVFCTLVFNANGQLTGIAFAPSRTGTSQAQQAEQTVNGLSFTVTGLNYASHYGYTLDVKDASNTVLQTYTGTFNTNGYQDGGDPTGLQNADATNGIQKFIQDGKLYIIRGGQTYDASGREVK